MGDVFISSFSLKILSDGALDCQKQLTCNLSRAPQYNLVSQAHAPQTNQCFAPPTIYIYINLQYSFQIFRYLKHVLGHFLTFGLQSNNVTPYRSMS